MKFAFVILNYNTSAQTEKCIDSILARMEGCDFKIALLDNGSNDSSCRNLVEQKYQKLNMGGGILFSESCSNLGFAGGNNLMFEKIAKSGFDADFYIFLNNDVYLVSNDFCQQIKDEYRRSEFALLGPRIILGKNSIDSCPFALPTTKDIRMEIRFWKCAKFFSSLRLVWLFLFCKKIVTFAKKAVGKKTPCIDKSARRETVLLHGACLIFSKSYFDFYKEPFDRRTFLYKEEELLFLRLLRKNLLSVFEPNLIVFHEGGSSTVKNRNLNQVFKFRSEHYLQSLSILLLELEEFENVLAQRY